MSGVPYTFGNATTTIALSNLDVNFATPATIGTTSVGLGNTTTTLVGLTNVSTTVVNTSNVASNTSLLLQSNGSTTAVTIDTAQNVGVGVTPSAWSAGHAIETTYAGHGIWGNAQNEQILMCNAYYNSGWKYAANSQYATQYSQRDGAHIFYNAPQGGGSAIGTAITWTQAMTLNNSSNGQLGIGVSPNSGWASSTYSVAQVGAYGSFYANNLNTSTGYNLYYDGTNNRYANNGYAAVMSWASNGQIQTATAGSGTAGNTISFTTGPYVANTGTSWTNGSDERLKNITGLITNGLESVNTLRAAKFTWKADTTNKPQVGLIAQDVQKVLPEAVNEGYTVQGDETQYLGVAYTEVIPLLVAAIQELSAQVTALQTEVTALQAKVGV